MGLFLRGATCSRRMFFAYALVLLSFSGGGCGDDGGAEGPADGAATYDAPLYMLMSNVYLDEDRTVYLVPMPSLDVDEVSLRDGREFSGVANFEAIGGRLLVSSGESPIITEYAISDDFGWQEGETVSFGEFPLEDNANFFYQYIVDEHHMYMPFEGYKRVVWDPTDLEIDMVMDDTTLEPEIDGLPIEAAGNRAGIRYEGAVMMPFFYHDENWFRFAPVSHIAVYDPQTHEEEKVIEAPCAGLAIASQDEDGNTYFSSWDYGPLLALYGMGPAPCTARVTPDRELDDAFTTDFTAWTGGRYAINFVYIRDGWGLANVCLGENFEIAEDATEIDADHQETIWNDENWQVWKIDLENERAEPFDQVDVKSSGWGSVKIDGRSFMTVPYEDGGRTKIYEIDDEGNVTEHLDVEGDASFIRVR
jgi:hypothetical protein